MKETEIWVPTQVAKSKSKRGLPPVFKSVTTDTETGEQTIVDWTEYRLTPCACEACAAAEAEIKTRLL